MATLATSRTLSLDVADERYLKSISPTHGQGAWSICHLAHTTVFVFHLIPLSSPSPPDHLANLPYPPPSPRYPL